MRAMCARSFCIHCIFGSICFLFCSHSLNFFGLFLPSVPMMNHHTMPKYGFGKTSMGSFYLPKICTKGGGVGTGGGKCGSGNSAHNTVSLELSHGNNKQLITLPAEKLDNNKRYYVTFTLKENAANASIAANAPQPAIIDDAKK